MTFMQLKTKSDELYTKDELLKHLRENGESDRALTKVREKYLENFGNELVWRYPVSDGLHAGFLIVVVQEGFLSLPYDIMGRVEGEIFVMERAALLNEDALECFITDWALYSDDLLSALKGMLEELRCERDRADKICMP